jgi:hypothetical protein
METQMSKLNVFDRADHWGDARYSGHGEKAKGVAR